MCQELWAVKESLGSTAEGQPMNRVGWKLCSETCRTLTCNFHLCDSYISQMFFLFPVTLTVVLHVQSNFILWFEITESYFYKGKSQCVVFHAKACQLKCLQMENTKASVISGVPPCYFTVFKVSLKQTFANSCNVRGADSGQRAPCTGTHPRGCSKISPVKISKQTLLEISTAISYGF